MYRAIIFWALLLIICDSRNVSAQDQYSVARKWNKVLLEAIRNDYARPTVHARNLFHTSIALYDGWAVYDDVATPFFLGRTLGTYRCSFSEIEKPEDIKAAREECMSYAAYRLLKHRFADSPGRFYTYQQIDSLFAALGYDASFTSINYTTGSPAALGNYLAQNLKDFGLQDGANEQNGYANRYYNSTNPPLIPDLPGNPDIINMNRWQPLTLENFVDQAGNPIPINTPEFLSPEWGNVVPFSLTESDKTVYERNGSPYWVYHDPGPPPHLDLDENTIWSEEYKWGFALVAIWSCHHDSEDGVLWDISPASQGNIHQYPETLQGYHNFYNLQTGGGAGQGHAVNPYTGKPYEPQWVPRGDFTRVLAEFWADGPDSETPPGHWFTILNYVSDHPNMEKRFKGEGPVLDDLEWDVKAYLTLGGTVHDAAVAAWSIKGWYDYIRPVSAIRGMADFGQSSNPALPGYSPAGIPLIPGYIEVVQAGDTLAGEDGENIGKIKLYTWKGHPSEVDSTEETDVIGVDWILAEKWWPYQRPSFVTPPFAGYISGHSTFSRAAAEVLTMLTGNPFFPGGMSEFHVKKDEFLVFEKGPSIDIVLQWATYQDAADQSGLSRLWGGIHPPADDIPGRLIGEKIGKEAFAYAESFFEKEVVTEVEMLAPDRPKTAKIYPNPLERSEWLNIKLKKSTSTLLINVFNAQGKLVYSTTDHCQQVQLQLKLAHLPPGFYLLRLTGDDWVSSQKIYVM